MVVPFDGSISDADCSDLLSTTRVCASAFAAASSRQRNARRGRDWVIRRGWGERRSNARSSAGQTAKREGRSDLAAPLYAFACKSVIRVARLLTQWNDET